MHCELYAEAFGFHIGAMPFQSSDFWGTKDTAPPRYRRCALWHNHHVIDIEANHLLQLSHGDYVRFHLPWSPDDDMDYLFGQECQPASDEHAALFQVQASIIITDGGHFSGASAPHCPIQMRSIRERRPPRDLLPHALQEQLRALWDRPHLRQRFPDRSEVMLFDTWFLSNRGFHRCEVPRLAALPPDVSTWISHLRHVWSDRADAMHIATIVPVQPGTSDQQHGGHLILLQDILPTQAGCLFSRQGPGNPQGLPVRFAAIFEQPMTIESFLTQTENDLSMWTASGYLQIGLGGILSTAWLLGAYPLGHTSAIVS